MGVDAEAVVAPDDVLKELVVPPVVRRVDDALVLPAAPRVSAGGSEPDAESVGELAELRSALAHPLGRFPEVRAPAGLDLDFGSDQLPDEVLVELRPRSTGLELLEAIRQLEGVGIEQCELFLHRDGEVLSVLESLTCRPDLLVGSESLVVTHLTSVNEAIPANRWRRARAAGWRHSSSSSAARPLDGPQRRAPRALRA